MSQNRLRHIQPFETNQQRGHKDNPTANAKEASENTCNYTEYQIKDYF
jgi:hypothetical protein